MSWQAADWARKQQIICEPHARSVLIVLGLYASADGSAAYPSIATLARDTGISRRPIQARLRILERAGLIRRGDQSLAETYPEGMRPVVYDLALKVAPQKVVPIDPVARAAAATHAAAAEPAAPAPAVATAPAATPGPYARPSARTDTAVRQRDALSKMASFGPIGRGHKPPEEPPLTTTQEERKQSVLQSIAGLAAAKKVET
jgi:hypothetical protein